MFKRNINRVPDAEIAIAGILKDDVVSNFRKSLGGSLSLYLKDFDKIKGAFQPPVIGLLLVISNYQRKNGIVFILGY